MRAGLRDDRCVGADPVFSARAGLADDCDAGCAADCGTPADESSPWPVLELRQRYRDGYDDDGNPVFAWETLVSQAALITEKREEFDAEAGATRVTGVVRMLNPGTLTEVPETCMVVQVADESAVQDLFWRITGSVIGPALLEFKVERTDGGR